MLFIPGMASGMIYVPCDKYLKAHFLFVLSTNRCLLRVWSSLLGVDYLPVEYLSFTVIRYSEWSVLFRLASFKMSDFFYSVLE